jgi:putative acetyltransferase
MIRPYCDKDLDQLLSAWAAASALAHPFLSAEFVNQERENIPNLYLPNSETWICERGGRVDGFVALLGNEVGALFVHPDHHRQGIGRGLMDKAAELRGDLEVEVFAANEIGRAFYDRYGFRFLDRTRHEPTGQDLLRLRFTVPAPRGA